MDRYLVGTTPPYDRDGNRKPSSDISLPVWNMKRLSSPERHLRGFFYDICVLDGRIIDGSPALFGGSEERIYSWNLNDPSPMPSTTYILASEKRHALEDITLLSGPDGETRLAAIADREGAETGSIFVWDIGKELPTFHHLIEGGAFERDPLNTRGRPKLCYDENSSLLIYTVRRDPDADPEKRSLRNREDTLYRRLRELRSEREGLRGEEYRRVNEEYTAAQAERNDIINELEMDIYEIRSLNPERLEREEFCLKSSRAPLLRSYDRLILIQTSEQLLLYDPSNRQVTEGLSYPEILGISDKEKFLTAQGAVSIDDPLLLSSNGERCIVRADQRGYRDISDLVLINLDKESVERFTQNEKVYGLILI